MTTLLWIVGVLFVAHVLFKGWIRFKAVMDCAGIGLARDYYDNAMAEWHQTGHELSLLESSEPPEEYKKMMDEHIAMEPMK